MRQKKTRDDVNEWQEVKKNEEMTFDTQIAICPNNFNNLEDQK